MIDTIVLRINDLIKHEALVEYLYKQSIEGTEIASQEMSEEETRLYLKRKIYIRDEFIDHSTGKTWKKSYRNHLKSSHYNLAYCIDYMNDCIELNYSVPKYWYGTNVIMFVPYHAERRYLSYLNAPFEEHMKIAYKRLKTSVIKLVQKELNGLTDLSEIEVNRYDLCFNQFFDTKADAIGYLNELKRVKRSHERPDTQKIMNYNSGIYSVNRLFTWKIYHKGTEFKKHDKKKLKGKNIDISLLQETADKIVRYELEVKRPLINYLYKEKYFFKNSSQLSEHVRLIRLDKKSNRKLNREDDQLIKQLNKKIFNKSFDWYLFNDLENDTAESIDIYDEVNYHKKLDGKMWNYSVKKFMDLFDQYQLGDLRAFNDVSGKVNYEKKNFESLIVDESKRQTSMFKGIRMGNVKIILNMLRGGSTWAEIKDSEILSERSIYRYKKLLKHFGVKDHNFFCLDNWVRPNNIRDYYEIVDNNFAKFNFSSNFKIIFGE